MDSLRTVAATAAVCRVWHERLGRANGLLRQGRLQAGLQRQMPTLPCSAQVLTGDWLGRDPKSYDWMRTEWGSNPDRGKSAVEHLQGDLEALQCVKKLDLSKLRLRRSALLTTVGFIAVQADACTSLRLPFARHSWFPQENCGVDLEVTETILESLSQLKSLTDLNLSGTNLREVPQNLSGLTRLTSLNLSSNGISTLPEWMAPNLPHLRELNLAFNPLQSLPSTFSEMRQLKKLDMHGYSMQSFRPCLKKMPNLVTVVDNDSLRACMAQLKTLVLKQAGFTLYPAPLLAAQFMDPPDDDSPRHPIVCCDPAGTAESSDDHAVDPKPADRAKRIPRLRGTHYAAHLEAVKLLRRGAPGGNAA
jgi:hypothetical protein